MKEHYCTYSQAVALKRLGFREEVSYYYTKEDAPQNQAWLTTSATGNPRDYNQPREWRNALPLYSAPRLDQAAAWLRDCKDTIVIAEPYWECEIEDDSDYLTGKWHFVVWKDGCRILCNFDPNKEDEELWLFDEYEQALSAGISAALELLGKEVNNGM